MGTSTSLLCPRYVQAISASTSVRDAGLQREVGASVSRWEPGSAERTRVQIDVVGAHQLARRVHRQLRRSDVDRQHARYGPR